MCGGATPAAEAAFIVELQVRHVERRSRGPRRRALHPIASHAHHLYTGSAPSKWGPVRSWTVGLSSMVRLFFLPWRISSSKIDALLVPVLLAAR